MIDNTDVLLVCVFIAIYTIMIGLAIVTKILMIIKSKKQIALDEKGYLPIK